MFTIVKLLLVLNLFLALGYVSVTGNAVIGKAGTMIKNASKNDKVFRCLNSIWYIAFGEDHAWDFIKGRKPEDFIHTSKVEQMAYRLQALTIDIEDHVKALAKDICAKHHPGKWKCTSCINNLYNGIHGDILWHVNLGPKQIPESCAPYSVIKVGKCEMLLAFVLNSTPKYKNTLMRPEGAAHLKLCEMKYDSKHIFEACHFKTGIDFNIFKHGGKDLDYLREFEIDNVCRGEINLPYA